MRGWSDDDHAEYEALMAEACGDPQGGRKATAETAERIHALLLDAEQAGRRWATQVLDDAVRSGLQSRAKQWLKKQSVVMVSYDGRTLGVSTRVGHRKRNGSTGEHQEVWQQSLIVEMTWEELGEHMAVVLTQLEALRVREAAVGRLLQLRERFPHTRGPAEALARLGLSLEEFLGEERVS